MVGIGLLIILGLLYFVPAIVAQIREHPSINSIFVINLFLGWTLLAWVGALAWAVSPVKTPKEDEKETVIQLY